MIRRRQSSTNSERSARDAEGRSRRAEEREARNAEKRRKKEEEETYKRNRHAKQRAKGALENRKRQEKKAKRQEEQDIKRKEDIKRADEDAEGYANSAKGIASAQRKGATGGVKQALEADAASKRAKNKSARLKRDEEVKKRQRKHKTDLLTAPVGEGKDLEHQKTLRKAAMDITGNTKDAKAMLERRAKGGADWTDKDEAKFNKKWKQKITDELPDETKRRRAGKGTLDQEAEDIVADRRQMPREVEAERKMAFDTFQKSADPAQVEARRGAMEQQGPDGRTAAESMYDEGFSEAVAAMADGKVTPEELKKAQDGFNSKGNDKLDSLEYNAETGTFTAKIKNSDGEESEIVVDPATLQALTSSFSEIGKSRDSQTKAQKRADIEAKKQVSVAAKKAVIQADKEIKVKREGAKLKAKENMTKAEAKEVDKQFANQEKSLKILAKRAEEKTKLSRRELSSLKKDIADTKRNMARANDKGEDGESQVQYYMEHLREIEAQVQGLEGANASAQAELIAILDKQVDALTQQAPQIPQVPQVPQNAQVQPPASQLELKTDEELRARMKELLMAKKKDK